MGVINVTPDSFSDGGRLGSVEQAVEAGLRLFAEGADIVDVGGESTRPSGKVYGGGLREISVEEELRRVLPVIEGLRRRTASPLSIDTRKAPVARAAIAAGASLVNDVSGGLFDPGILAECAQASVELILMHSRGTPEDMQERSGYGDVVADVASELRARVAAAEKAGVAADRLWIDPGLGFAKTAEQSRVLLSRLDELLALCRRIVVGASRKSFLGSALPPAERLPESLTAAVLAAQAGASMVRVHDVAETARALSVLDVIGGRRGLPRGSR
jgi:dihydropteroate synthase